MKKVLIILGIILILVQVVNYIGVSNMYVQLLPDNGDLSYPIYTSRSGLNLKKMLFAIEAGMDRFHSGFEDLTFSKNEYRVMTATQMTSATIRESLGCSSGGSIALYIYDSILIISYSFVGIIGVALIMIAIFKKPYYAPAADKAK